MNMRFVVLGFAFIAIVDLGPIIRDKAWRDLLAFSLLFLSSLTMAVLSVIGVDVPSAILILGKMLEALGITYGPD